MTDTAFYDRMGALAQRLMDKFGTPATFKLIAVSKPDATGKVVKTPSDSPGLAVRLTSKDAIINMELKGEVAYVYKGPVTPKIGGHIIHAGVSWEVVDTRTVNPTGSKILMSFHGVKLA